TVGAILDLSRIETGAFELRPTVLTPALLVEKLVGDFQVLADEKGLSLSCQIDETSATVIFDEYCLTSALSNLLQNALKFTERGEVLVRLYSDTLGMLCLDVRDTGVGIAASYQARLFEPFSQEHFGYTRKFEGSGLGLALGE